MNNVDSDSDVMICEFCGDTNDTREAIVQNYINCTKFAGSTNPDSGNSFAEKSNASSIKSENSNAGTPNPVSTIGVSLKPDNSITEPVKEETVKEETAPVEDGNFIIEDRAVVKYIGESVNVVVPDGIVAIGNNAFEKLPIQSVVIPLGVKSIGHYAFANCEALTSVKIPVSVERIGSDAFTGCTLLSDVTLKEGLQNIGPDAFAECVSLRSISFPGTITSVGPGAFSGCTSLKNLTIPSNYTNIAPGTFSGCTSLISVSFLKGVTSIGAYAFSNCIKIVEVTLPTGVTGIGPNAFRGCTSLNRVTIPACVIENNAFMDCTSLTNVIWLGEPFKDVKPNAFENTPFARGEQQKVWMKAGLCRHCGSTFVGVFNKTCSNPKCGKPQDY